METLPQWNTASGSNNWQNSYAQSDNDLYYSEPQDLTKNYVTVENHRGQLSPYTTREFHDDRQIQNSYPEDLPCSFSSRQGLDLSSIGKMNLVDYDYGFDNVQQPMNNETPGAVYSNMPNPVLENLPENYCIDERLPDLGNVDVWVDDNQSLPPHHIINESHYGEGTSFSTFTNCDTTSMEISCIPTSVHNPNSYQNGLVDIAELDDLTQRDMYLEMQKYPPSYQYKRNNKTYNSVEILTQTQECLSQVQPSGQYNSTCRDEYQVDSDPTYFEKHFDAFECNRDTPPSACYQDSYLEGSPRRPLNLTEDMEEFPPMQTPPRYRPVEVEEPPGEQIDPLPCPVRFKCKLCDAQFDEQAELKKHKKEHKSKVKCPRCPQYLADANTLKIHMRKHTGEKPLKCPICSQRFQWQSNYYCHLRKHTGVKPYQCTKCDKKFRLLSTLKTHEYVHEGLKPHACNQCDSRFTQGSALRRHLLTHSDVRAFKCSLCDKTFRAQEYYKKHMDRHAQKAKTACEICGLACTNSKKLEIHKMTHNEGTHPYKCDLCTAQFKALKNLTQHKKRSHQRKELYECKVCKQTFKQKMRLKSHMKEHEEFPCSICDASFIDSKKLSTHELTHKSKGSYECSLCGLYFHKKAQWKYHEETCENVPSPQPCAPPSVPSEPPTYSSIRSSKNIVPPAKLLTEVLENFDRCEAFQNFTSS